CQLTSEDIDRLSKEISANEITKIPNASIIMSKEKEPWLHTLGNIQTSYADRYKKYLTEEEDFSRQVVDKIYETTDNILDFMANPTLQLNKIKKGLVMGNVQSGKTANYLSLINKASDVGYKLIILITGVHENLRKQTQGRVNSGFIGFDRFAEPQEIGVSKYGEVDRPFSFTNSEHDFKTNVARSLGFNPKQSNVPVILIIKKNPTTLKNVIEWLETNQTKSEYLNYPLLLIDDEADNASIDTDKDPDKSTTINRLIRTILNMFTVRSYVGYTATPFANIFINPSSKKDEYGVDLFPEDFIVSLESPDSYIGPQKIFGETDNSMLQTIKDIDYSDGSLHDKLKKDDMVIFLPKSLLEAIDFYLLTIGIKKLRKVKSIHTSMLINVSFRIEVQIQVKDLVQKYVEKISNAIRYNAYQSLNQMLKNEIIKSLFVLWEEKVDKKECSFEELLRKIEQELGNLKLFLVNSKINNDEKLGYDKFKEEGLNAITIGGYSLSRGFTVEGLTVSYFLRNSKMYDTLLQMGRWFGYRHGYDDICKIYMRNEAINWYKHITDSTEELREEFKIMNDHGLTPREYGLKVKNHEESLIITAKNKMRHSANATISIDYYGELIETRKLLSDQKKVRENLETLKQFVTKLSRKPRDKYETKNFLWKDIDSELALEFIKKYNNHPLNIKTDYKCVEKYIENQNYKFFDVAIITNKDKDSGYEVLNDSITIYRELRSSFIDEKTIQVSGNKSRVGSISDEKIGLDKTEISNFAAKLNGKQLSGADYRQIRKEKPLLILHILKIQEKNNDQDPYKYPISVVAYGISFPGEPNYDKKKSKSISYTVNKTWLKNNNLLEEDVDDEE
ncbi:MAG: Z1 domain-containing protein, partial [Aliarcobacter butzleri]|nr:Z1 domain-containing protein [Aliarcobacter butzleri]